MADAQESPLLDLGGGVGGAGDGSTPMGYLRITDAGVIHRKHPDDTHAAPAILRRCLGWGGVGVVARLVAHADDARQRFATVVAPWLLASARALRNQRTTSLSSLI